MDLTPANFYQQLTGAGPAAIAVIRICGPLIREFADRHLRLRKPLSAGAVIGADLLDDDGQSRDDILVAVIADQPHFDLRLCLHGNPWQVRETRAALERIGFCDKPDTPLWPTANPIEAAGLALMPKMLTHRGVEWLLRQMKGLPEELLRIAACDDAEESRRRLRQLVVTPSVEEWFTEPLRIAIVGRPNVGKSTLMNALADKPVSLVADVPGTTRDWIEHAGEAEGFPVVWIDTAGIRHASDPLEREGIDRARVQAAQADLSVLVLDARDTTDANLDLVNQLNPAVVAWNKCDLVPKCTQFSQILPDRPQARVSALRRQGLAELIQVVVRGAARNHAQVDAISAFTDELRAKVQRLSVEKDPQLSLSRLVIGL